MAPSRRKGASKAAAATAARRQWKIGDLVLAKVKGFPAWPATVSEPEKWGYSADWKKVLVYFFGTQQIAFCNPADVEAFTEEKKQSLLGKRHGKGADFVRAVHEIIESYENMKKQVHTNNANVTDGHTLVTENSSEELLVTSLANGDPPVTSQSGEKKTHRVAEDVNAKSENAAAMIGRDGLKDKDMPEKEEISSLVVTEMVLANVDSSRENSERSEGLKIFTRRRPASARRARSAPRAVPSKPQTRTTRSGMVAPSILHDGPGRRNKRIRKSPNVLYEHDVNSLDLVSNGSIEGNDSEILTAESDSPSFNDGSTVESACKTVLPDSTIELCQRNVELSHTLEFQTNGISKKKRMPNRKRSSSDAVEFANKPDDKTVSDVHAVKREHIPSGDHDISIEKFPKEDGDEHLPLVKRARVRMGRTLSTGEQPETSLDTEEKPLEVCSSASDHVHVSSDREGDDSSDRHPSVKGDLENLTQPEKHQPIKQQVWEVRKYQHFGSSVEGEAALPPSKRLHRALEAMSANVAEDQKASDVPSATVADTSGCCSPCSDDCSKSFSERKVGSEFGVCTAEENLSNNKSQDRASECSMKLDLPIKEGRVLSAERVACCSGESGRQNLFQDNLSCFDDKNMLKSSTNDTIDSVVVQSSESVSPRGAHVSSPCSPGVALSLDNDCKAGSSKLVKPSENVDLITNHSSGDNLTVHSPHSATNTETDRAGEECDRTVNLCQLVPDENKLPNGMSKDVGESGLAMEDYHASLCAVSTEVMSNNIEGQDQSHSSSTANDNLGDRTTSDTKCSSSPTYLKDTNLRAKLRTATCNIPLSVNNSIQADTSHSPVVRTNNDIQRSAGKWNYKEAHDALTSFEGFLGTLTRTKESIGRATRSAIDCAKFGVAAKVVEIVAHSLEREASLHRRVDLFFLVDSIAQCSRGLKGDGSVYPSAILAVLPRLLSAAAPPGSNSQENRRQCLKVLRVWQERRILPESIVRHHIRELDSLCGSSCSRTLSRRLRNERAFDDPIREMEGMLVDEYGSNSSIQLPGFRMPPMLRDEDDGIDSDGESFEAVTPEHDNEKAEGERNPVSGVEKHRHILEDVDGELEMEDVAPPSEAVISSSDSAAANNVQTTQRSIGNVVVTPFAPPLPRDVPPVSPPLPRSPPPPPPPVPRASFPLPPEMPDNLSSNMGSVYIQSNEDDLRESSGPHSNASGVNPTICDAQSSRPGHIEFHSQVPNSTHCSLNSQPTSNPPVRAVNNIPPSDGAFNKGFRLRPPHPAPSNQFSYVQADRRGHSRRDIPPPSHPTRFHVQNTENGNFYRGSDRVKLPPHDNGEHWRAPPFPGSRYPDGSRMPYTPAPYAGQHAEPAGHGNRWGDYPPGNANHRVAMPHRPPNGGLIPVAARGPNYWRPR